MKPLINHNVADYLKVLAERKPVPGGGSATALTAALGASLICMVSKYSLGRDHTKTIENKINRVLQKAEVLQGRLTELIDLDAQAYLEVVESRKGTKAQKQKALRNAAKVPREICQLCYKAMDLASVLVNHGNPNLLADVEIAVELLTSAFNGSLSLQKID